jgi:hypothetical protein
MFLFQVRKHDNPFGHLTRGQNVGKDLRKSWWFVVLPIFLRLFGFFILVIRRFGRNTIGDTIDRRNVNEKSCILHAEHAFTFSSFGVLRFQENDPISTFQSGAQGFRILPANGHFDPAIY